MNPEFQRYLWLEFTPYRLIAMPLILGAIFWLASFQDTQTVSHIAIAAYLIITGFWGTYKAADSIAEEVNDNTWDFQRLSSLSPLSLALGKLFGSTAYAWYGGLIALGVYAYTSSSPLHRLLISLMTLIGSAILSHTVALLASCPAIHAHQGKEKIRISGFQMIGLAAGLCFLPSIQLLSFLRKGDIYQWYGFQIDAETANLVSLYFFIGWAVIGLYRKFRQMLHYRNSPSVFLGFVIFLIIYLPGWWLQGEAIADSFLIHAFTIVFLTFYFSALTEAYSPLYYHQLVQYLREGNKQRFMEQLPCWSVALLVLMVLYIAVFSTNAASGFIGTEGKLILYISSILLFSLRDLFLFHYFRFSTTNKRAKLAILVHLLVLYIVLPALCNAVHLPALAYAFWPINFMVQIFPVFPNWAIFFPMAEVLAVGWLLYKRWQKVAARKET